MSSIPRLAPCLRLVDRGNGYKLHFGRNEATFAGSEDFQGNGTTPPRSEAPRSNAMYHAQVRRKVWTLTGRSIRERSVS